MSLVNNWFFFVENNMPWNTYSSSSSNNSIFICTLFFLKCYYYFSTSRYEFLWKKKHTQFVLHGMYCRKTAKKKKSFQAKTKWMMQMMIVMNVCKRWNRFIQNSSIWIKTEAERKYNTISQSKQCHVFLMFFDVSILILCLFFSSFGCLVIHCENKICSYYDIDTIWKWSFRM